MKYTIELTNKQKAQMDCMIDIVHRYVGFNPKLEMEIPRPMKASCAYKKGFEDGNKIADKDLKEIQDSTYDVAYNEALKDTDHAMDVLKSMTVEECEEWFGGCIGVDDVICGFTVQRIIEITKAYEEKKKAEEYSIKVGDEVVCNCPNEQRVIITAICDGWVTFMRKDGACYSRADKDLKKTGRHFEEISQLLDKMKGEE